jgi:hypothetical protein
MARAVFLKNEFLLAVVIGMVVLAFVHSGAGRKRDNSDAGSSDDSSNIDSFSYIKIFVGTIIAVYILLYLLNNSSAATNGGGAILASSNIITDDNKILADAMDSVLRNIDLGDPSF